MLVSSKLPGWKDCGSGGKPPLVTSQPKCPPHLPLSTLCWFIENNKDTHQRRIPFPFLALLFWGEKPVDSTQLKGFRVRGKRDSSPPGKGRGHASSKAQEGGCKSVVGGRKEGYPDTGDGVGSHGHQAQRHLMAAVHPLSQVHPFPSDTFTLRVGP